MKHNKCKICHFDVKTIFTKNVLGKYNVTYFQCKNCGFLQTEKPYWLGEAYSDAITSLDIGLVNRNIQYSNLVEDILYKHFDKNNRFLDFAGGYGMFTRLMRDKGFDFYHEDKHCENIFAKYFTINDLKPEDKKFELITAFELMEHVENPFVELDYIFSITDNFLFSTELIPILGLENWWYLGEEHGQHISFYTTKTIEKIAKKYNKEYYTNGYMHLLTNKKGLNPFKITDKYNRIFSFLKKNILVFGTLASKTRSDYEYIKNKND
jgi:hypothetical protein